MKRAALVMHRQAKPAACLTFRPAVKLRYIGDVGDSSSVAYPDQHVQAPVVPQWLGSQLLLQLSLDLSAALHTGTASCRLLRSSALHSFTAAFSSNSLGALLLHRLRLLLLLLRLLLPLQPAGEQLPPLPPRAAQSTRAWQRRGDPTLRPSCGCPAEVQQWHPAGVRVLPAQAAEGPLLTQRVQPCQLVVQGQA